MDIIHLLILKVLLKIILRLTRDQNVANEMSLYKLIAEYADISIATVYRKISELITWGYLVRVNKNNYLITVKGLITLALLCMNGSIKDDEVCQDVVSYLSVNGI